MRIHFDHNTNLFKNEENHLSLFRLRKVIYDEKFEYVFNAIKKIGQI
jgi:hypothetical protein